MSNWMEPLLLASRDAAVLSVVTGGLLWLAGRRIPAGWRHALWLLVAVRLLMPVLPTSPASWQRVLTMGGHASGDSLVVPIFPVVSAPVASTPPLEPSVFASENPLFRKASPPPLFAQPREPLTIWELAFCIWLCGVVAIFGVGTLLSVRFGRRVKSFAVPRHPGKNALEVLLQALGREYGWRKLPRLQVTAAVDAPALFGVFHPQILMPPAALERLSEIELRLVLLHELGHWRRRDLWVNLGLALLQAVHWFNPLVWWAFHRTRIESESATDAWVLRRAGAKHVANYGEMLLQLLDQTRKQPAGYSGIVSVVESPQDLRRRMTGIGRFTGCRNRWAVFGSAVILLGLAAVGLTQPPDPAKGRDAATYQAGDTFTCRVVSPEGTPAAVAEVFLEVTEEIEERPVEILRLAGKTDKAGNLQIPIRPEWRDIKYLSLHLFAKHDGSGYGAVSNQLPAADSVIMVKLTPGSPLRFRILDEKRMPIPDLPLRIIKAQIPVYSELTSNVPRFWGNVPQLPKGYWNAVTDQNGRCVIKGLPPGQYYVDHDDPKYGQIPGRHHHAFQYNPEEQGAEIEVQLGPALTVIGTVRLPDGTAVNGAKVRILEASDYAQGGVSAETLTNTKGQYELQRLLPSDYALQVQLNPELNSDWTSEPVELNLRASELRKEVNPVILRGGLITGKVTLSDTRAAVADLLVSVVSSGHSHPLARWYGTTDRSGHFQIRVPVGMRKVYLAGQVPEGYARETKDGGQLEAELNVEDGGNHTINFAVPPESWIGGLVVDESGQPVAGANVTCFSPNVSPFGSSEVVSDATGRFSIAMPAGTESAELFAEFDGAISASGANYPVGKEVKLELKVGELASASGRVVDVNGEPVTGASVRWDGRETNGIPVTAVTDAEGRFQAKKVLPDKQIIFYGAKGGYGRNSSFAEFKAGQAVELRPIVLHPADATLAGKVVDASGNPVSGAKVEASSEFQPEDASAISNSDGEFVLKGLVKGWLFVKATKSLQGEALFHARMRTHTDGGDVVVKPSDRPDPLKPEKLNDLLGKSAPPLKAQSWFLSDRLPESRPGKVRLISILGLDRSLRFFSNILSPLQKLREEIPDQELEIIVVHGAWPRKEVAEILESDFPNFKLPVAIESDKGAMSKAFGTHYWLTIVIDQEGKVVLQNRGDWGQAKKKVMDLLGKGK